MTTIAKDFARKIIAAGGVYDTRRYRYVATNNRPGFARINLDCLGTTAAYMGWEPVASPSYDAEHTPITICSTH